MKMCESVLQMFYMCRLRTCLNLFFSLIWMCLLIYYMLGQVLDTKKHHHKQLQKDIFFDGQPSSLMAELGFDDVPRFYPQSYQDEEDLPIFILPLHSKQMEGFFGFLFSFRHHYPGRKLLIYDLDLSSEQLHMVNAHCKCLVRKVHWNRYPKHVSSLRFKAYLPLIIQEGLVEFGAIFLCDTSMRFNSSDLDPAVTTRAFMYGFSSWSTSDTYPTSTFTHYNMFRFFNASHDDYYFHRMVDPAMALYYNTKDLHHKLMLPWVKCSLDYDCLNPLGAQPFGCNFLHKPKYIYAGCHKYDIAAFNVLAGLMFDFDTPYISNKMIFRIDIPSKNKQVINVTNVGL